MIISGCIKDNLPITVFLTGGYCPLFSLFHEALFPSEFSFLYTEIYPLSLLHSLKDAL